MITFKPIKAKHILLAQKVGDNLEAVLNLYGQLVADWDFKDENGKDLPTPDEDPEIMLELTMEQITEVTVALRKYTELPKESGNNS